MLHRRIATSALALLAIVITSVLIAPQGEAAELSERPTCAEQISAYLRANAHSVRLQADSGRPVSQNILEIGPGCTLEVSLEFHAGGGRAVERTRTTSTVTAYPYPPSPDSTAGVDPYCKLRSYAHDSVHFTTWIAELFQYWDNYAPCCATLVNPRAQQNVAVDPFFVVTNNEVSDTWVVYPTQVQATGHAAFHSNAGPTDDGVDHWIRAWSDGCIADAVFWGPAPGGGHYHEDPVKFVK